MKSCLSRAASPILLLGDSHIRRHYKELLGRDPDVYAWYNVNNVVAFGGENPPQLESVKKADAHVLDSATKMAISPWCLGRFNDIDCLCYDVAYGPKDLEPNPLNFIFKHRMRAKLSSVGGGVAEVSHAWFVGFLVPEWRQEFRNAVAASMEDKDGSGIPPRVVVFDLGHWDVAFTTLLRFEHDLPDFITELAEAFPAPALLVYRTPTFFAGSDTSGHNDKLDRFKGRKFTTGGKLAWVREITLRELRAHPDVAPRLRIWDVWQMGEARLVNSSIYQLQECSNGHEGAADIHVENQVLFNIICPADM